MTRTYPPFRPRRPFRKYYYALFLLAAIFCWHIGTHSRSKHSAPARPLSARSSPTRFSDNAVTGQDSRYHGRRWAGSVENLPVAAPSTPNQTPGPIVGKENVGLTRQLSEDDFDTDVQLAGEIERIGGERHDSVEHSAKLTHPDDDDGGMTDTEDPVFGSNGQVPLRNKGSQERVEELLNVDYSSKDKFRDHSDEEGDVDQVDLFFPASPQYPIESTQDQMTWSANYVFPTWEECQSVKEKADSLPDLVHVPFEVSVKDVVLEGWEDEWISRAHYAGPKLQEPKIDFVYNWINGSQPELSVTMHPYELNSTLNDPEGLWISSHGSNRYREWDELRYSIRSVEKYAGHFMNRIQILVNAFKNLSTDESLPATYGKQRPHWLRDDLQKVQVLSQEEFFGPDERKCLPSFDSLTIENQLYNTKSEVDRLFALSDDMLLGKPHAASDIYSPLFGPTLGFKDNAYNTLQPPTEKDAERFGEKPFLIYTSWLLNRRFGARKRKGQVHFGHSLSRSITKEAITSFPRPAMRSAYQRFRGETGFQLYSWYVVFHYTMERHREALLWSYIMLRSDLDDDGYLNWHERKTILNDLAEGMSNDSPEVFRRRIYYRMGDHLEEAGLHAPKVNTDILWTSLDGPIMIKDLVCDAFDTEDCLAPGFSMQSSDAEARSPVFTSATIFDRLARESPRCGDCLIKLILNRRRAGLGPLLPHASKKPEKRAIVIKALMKFQYTIVAPDAMFYMVTDAEQAEHVLLKPYIEHNKKAGQICLNDDVVTSDEQELNQLRKVMSALFEGLLPDASTFEK